MEEAGLPNFGGTIWFGVQAHGKTPRAIVERLSKDISSVIMRPEISEEMVKQATQPYVMTPDAFAARIRADADSYAKIIKAANIKFE
jgi:tripartite-type tricarboxylate transporter receptor subunit TctC